MKDHLRHEAGSSLFGLFRLEAENQIAVLTTGLLELERSPGSTQSFVKLLRAAHSLKGAARIVNLQSVVRLTHAIEDCLIGAQNHSIELRHAEIDRLFQALDWVQQSSRVAETNTGIWEAKNTAAIDQLLLELQQLPVQPAEVVISSQPEPPKSRPSGSSSDKADKTVTALMTRKSDASDRVLRMTAENLNQLLGLAGQSLVESRWLRPFADSMHRLRELQSEVEQQLRAVRDAPAGERQTAAAGERLAEATRKLAECRHFLAEKLEELDLFDRRSAQLSHRLYLEVLRARMRPFGDALRRFPRMVRDLARGLGKEARLEISGDTTLVDRDILERLEAPLTHLLRNAVDHGCEPPAIREQSGKHPQGRIQLDARHSAGMLLVTVADDGPGIDQTRLRQLIAGKQLTPPALADKLGESELLEFLFLPGVTLKSAVTEISGRGIGLDVVQSMVKSVRGTVRVSTQPGRGTQFQLHLPLTISVLRALLVNIGGEPYAFPLSQIHRTLKLLRTQLQTVEGRLYVSLEGQQIELLAAHQVLECDPQPYGAELPIVIIGDRNRRYGLIVDRFLGERELIVQPLDSRLGRIQDVHAAALLEDGSPVLILHVEDLLNSVEMLITTGASGKAAEQALGRVVRTRKRILLVDDSLAVREFQRRLLAGWGYLVDVAVDGLDAWEAVRTGHYDLLITDVDMPRLDGIELANRIKSDPALNALPVLMVSYKDGEEDRKRGLHAGADVYLAKGSFQDERMMQVVRDLVGMAEA